MDLVPVVNGVVAQTGGVAETVGPQLETVLAALRENWVSWLLLSVFAFGLLVFLRSVGKRLVGGFEASLFDNWRLALLGLTGLVLSLASGWTTWDGMRNFTGEPALSFMITFGIQGVMLIVAWLIGESFATGMHARGPGSSVQRLELVIGTFIGVLIVAGIVYLYVAGRLPFTTEQLAYGVLILGAVALVFLFQSELARPYLQSSRIIVRNAVLWVMFLACMATSVFFSFDSLFSTIFPAEERARAAELRAQNQVSGILADIGQTIATEELQETQRLFQTDGWRQYEQQLDNLARVAQGSQDDIEAYFVQKLEERQRAINEQENRKASAESQQAAMKTRKTQLTEELSRLKAERPGIATAVVQQVQVVSEVRRRMDEQRAIMLAEEKGVEGSGKAGRGPLWRAARAQLARIEAELQVAQERLRGPRERLERVDRRISAIQGELAQLDGELAKLQGEALTAEQRILAAQKSKEADEVMANLDPARILPDFDKAKIAFRQQPTRKRLNTLRTQCQNLIGALSAVEATKDRVRAIDCDPKQAAEAATPLFALRDGADLFLGQCAGGDKLEAQTTTDDLFAFARRCLSDSGLSSDNTEALRTKINLAELNRDDKAHRFVVTWNAFQDGNRLAYLALAIAIAIDSLVFMSGLFGANAVRSPLQDVPSMKPRTAKQLEATIEHALLPHMYQSARAALRAMQPITATDGFTNEVVLEGHNTEEENAVRRVLAAGASIGAVRDADPNYDRGHRFHVRPELLEFLAMIAKREFEGDKDLAIEAKEKAREGELKDILTVALRPHLGDHTSIVLNNLHPMTDMGDGYTSEVIMSDVQELQRPIVRRALNAGATLNYVRQRTSKTDRHHEFEVHRQLYRTLCTIAAANPPEHTWQEDAIRLVQSAKQAQLGSYDQRGRRDRSNDAPIDGGDLDEHREPLTQAPSQLLPQPQAGPSQSDFSSGQDDEDQAKGGDRNAATPMANRLTGSNDDGMRGGDDSDDALGHADGPRGPNAFHHAVVDHFASELGYQDSDLEDIMEMGRQLDVPLLRNALSRALMQLPKHSQTVATADRSLKSNIDRAYEVAPEGFVRTDEQAKHLDQFRETLKAVRTLFLLAPGGAYRNLLKDMESELQADMDDGTITPRQEQRFSHLKDHMKALDQADLRSLEGWDRIEQALWQFESQLSALANAGSGRAA